MRKLLPSLLGRLGWRARRARSDTCGAFHRFVGLYRVQLVAAISSEGNRVQASRAKGGRACMISRTRGAAVRSTVQAGLFRRYTIHMTPKASYEPRAIEAPARTSSRRVRAFHSSRGCNACSIAPPGSSQDRMIPGGEGYEASLAMEGPMRCIPKIRDGASRAQCKSSPTTPTQPRSMMIPGGGRFLD